MLCGGGRNTNRTSNGCWKYKAVRAIVEHWGAKGLEKAGDWSECSNLYPIRAVHWIDVGKIYSGIVGISQCFTSTATFDCRTLNIIS